MTSSSARSNFVTSQSNEELHNLLNFKMFLWHHQLQRPNDLLGVFKLHLPKGNPPRRTYDWRPFLDNPFHFGRSDLPQGNLNLRFFGHDCKKLFYGWSVGSIKSLRYQREIKLFLWSRRCDIKFDFWWVFFRLSHLWIDCKLGWSNTTVNKNNTSGFIHSSLIKHLVEPNWWKKIHFIIISIVEYQWPSTAFLSNYFCWTWAWRHLV